MITEHPVTRPIDTIVIRVAPDNSSSEWYRVGDDGVTRIEPCEKSGSMASVPYVRVWKGDVPYAEFCQHNIVGVYFHVYPVNVHRL